MISSLFIDGDLRGRWHDSSSMKGELAEIVSLEKAKERMCELEGFKIEMWHQNELIIREFQQEMVEYAATCFSFDLFEFQGTNDIHLSLIDSNPIGLALIIEGNVEFIAKSAMILNEDNRQNLQLN